LVVIVDILCAIVLEEIISHAVITHLIIEDVVVGWIVFDYWLTGIIGGRKREYVCDRFGLTVVYYPFEEIVRWSSILCLFVLVCIRSEIPLLAMALKVGGRPLWPIIVSFVCFLRGLLVVLYWA
jgi:hypothetical protein